MNTQAVGEALLVQVIAEMRQIRQTQRVKEWQREHYHGGIRICMKLTGPDNALAKAALDELDALGRDEWHLVAQNRTQAVHEFEAVAAQ